ncbi:hypothetical protein C475_12542 [Halosimplex carlsbadense 2-9-1]|uniref:Sulfatase N-terminal domain-containing protein n=1 Tax=Halosimplex carlsbadense 2-9-1 TaxID=797114 RepID=M0CRB9_9EURY|nr:hypothetical protein [Halosimplex carlsbadense]ELZ24419.1 hypothetical protein C475_12542 [Halosimplex carlsbadense 2-9-1]
MDRTPTDPPVAAPPRTSAATDRHGQMILGTALAKAWRLGREELSAGGELAEPLAYRAWKRLWQAAPAVGRDPDLFERLDATDWDALVLLDACRYDTLGAVADDAVVGRARSPASATPGFLAAAEAHGVFDGATYVSGNPQSGEHSPGDVEHVPVYEDHWDDDLATVPPDPIFEAAGSRVREGERVVAHTLQPHYPHLARTGDRTAPIPGGLHPRYFPEERLRGEKLQALLANGYLDLGTARRSYERSVRFAWETAGRFAADLAADGHRVVVSADHGELFGEWGFVEHPMGVSVPPLVDVPWVVFEPRSGADPAESVGDRLAALGYAES